MEELIKEEFQHFINTGYSLDDAKYQVRELVNEILDKIEPKIVCTFDHSGGKYCDVCKE